MVKSQFSLSFDVKSRDALSCIGRLNTAPLRGNEQQKEKERGTERERERNRERKREEQRGTERERDEQRER